MNREVTAKILDVVNESLEKLDAGDFASFWYLAGGAHCLLIKHDAAGSVQARAAIDKLWEAAHDQRLPQILARGLAANALLEMSEELERQLKTT